MTSTTPNSLTTGVPAPASVVAPRAHVSHAVRAGVLAGLSAYLLWGFIPLFFKLLAHVPPVVVLSHRILWSAVFVGLVLTFQHRWPEVAAAVCRRSTLLALAASTAMIAIWAIANDQVMQAGLGYFINPLVSVLLGVVFLRERLRAGQAAALLLATAGVLVQVVARGSFPWVALTLAWSFAFYALLRKTAPVAPLVGLLVETALLVPIAAFFAARFSMHGPPISARDWTLLAASGVITAVPLILFATAARRLTMATLGFMQFLSPTCQLLLAVFAFGEPFTKWHLASFGLIWLALVLYCLESLRAYRRQPHHPAAADAPEAVACAEV
jgi:chloramphenicol-sensitive protein RarD